MWCLWKCCDGDDSLHGALVCLSQPPVLLLITSRGHCKVGLRWSPLCASLFFNSRFYHCQDQIYTLSSCCLEKLLFIVQMGCNMALLEIPKVYIHIFLKIQWKFKISTVLHCLRNTARKEDYLVLRKVILNNTQKVKIQQSSIKACYYLTWTHTVAQWYNG